MAGILLPKLTVLPGQRVTNTRRHVVHAGARARADVSSTTTVATTHTRTQWAKLYIGTSPLVGWEPVAENMPPAVSEAIQLHTFVALQGQDGQQCWVLDFLPVDATSPATALALFSGRSVKGHLRSKYMQRWIRGPATTTRLIASLEQLPGGAVEQLVSDFNGSWDPELSLFTHNCRHYCEGLASALAGRPVLLPVLPGKDAR